MAHTYADDGRYLATLTVTDDDGAQAMAQFEVVVRNVAPVIAVSGVDRVGEGQEYMLDFGTIVDPGPDTVSQWIVHWGDGSWDAYTQPTPARHVYAEGPFDGGIQVELVDEDGADFGAGTAQVTIDNEAPAVTQLTGEDGGFEGSLLQFAAAAADAASSADPLTYTWDFGDGSPVVSGIEHTNVAHAYTDDGHYVVTLLVEDGDGGQSARSLPIVVRNVAPTIQLAGSSSAVEGTFYPLSLGTIADPGTDTVSQWRVDWGDGTATRTVAAGVVEHTYVDGRAQVTVDVTFVDEDGTYGSAGLIGLTVENAPPMIGHFAFESDGQEGDLLQFEVSAFDPAGEDDPLTLHLGFR